LTEIPHRLLSMKNAEISEKIMKKIQISLENCCVDEKKI